MNSIPYRSRGPVPDDAIWMLRCLNGHLGIDLADVIPPDTDLEHQLVKRAARAWRRSDRGRATAIVAILTVPLAWLWGHRQTAIAGLTGAGLAAAMTAALLLPGHQHHQPPGTAPAWPPVVPSPSPEPPRHPPSSKAPKPPPFEMTPPWTYELPPGSAAPIPSSSGPGETSPPSMSPPIVDSPDHRCVQVRVRLPGTGITVRLACLHRLFS